MIIGYGISGKHIAYNAKTHPTTYCIIELEPTAIGHAMQQGEHIIPGDARDKEVLKKAGVDKAAVVVISLTNTAVTEELIVKIRRMNPNAYIIAKTLFVSEIELMEKLGADEIIPAQWEASLQLSKRTISSLNRRQEEPLSLHPAY